MKQKEAKICMVGLKRCPKYHQSSFPLFINLYKVNTQNTGHTDVILQYNYKNSGHLGDLVG